VDWLTEKIADLDELIDVGLVEAVSAIAVPPSRLDVSTKFLQEVPRDHDEIIVLDEGTERGSKLEVIVLRYRITDTGSDLGNGPSEKKNLTPFAGWFSHQNLLLDRCSGGKSTDACTNALFHLTEHNSLGSGTIVLMRLIRHRKL
jgi:hypothetical protein